MRCNRSCDSTDVPLPPTNPLFITRNNQSKMNNWRVARCPNHTHGAERTCYSPESEQPFVACVSRAHQGAASGGGGGCALVHHINQTIAHSPHRNRTWCGAVPGSSITKRRAAEFSGPWVRDCNARRPTRNRATSVSSLAAGNIPPRPSTMAPYATHEYIVSFNCLQHNVTYSYSTTVSVFLLLGFVLVVVRCST